MLDEAVENLNDSFAKIQASLFPQMFPQRTRSEEKKAAKAAKKRIKESDNYDIEKVDVDVCAPYRFYLSDGTSEHHDVDWVGNPTKITPDVTVAGDAQGDTDCLSYSVFPVDEGVVDELGELLKLKSQVDPEDDSREDDGR